MTDSNADMSAERAVQIARQAIQGLVDLSSPDTVQIERRGRAFVVTFPIHHPPGLVLGADYDARVTIDASTGAVIEILGGS